jgi:hypothetical protein
MAMNPKPAAVHLMGEMTFTFALVRKLQAAGIRCVASTTARDVVEEGGGEGVEVPVCAVSGVPSLNRADYRLPSLVQT